MTVVLVVLVVSIGETKMSAFDCSLVVKNENSDAVVVVIDKSIVGMLAAVCKSCMPSKNGNNVHHAINALGGRLTVAGDVLWGRLSPNVTGFNVEPNYDFLSCDEDETEFDVEPNYDFLSCDENETEFDVEPNYDFLSCDENENSVAKVG